MFIMLAPQFRESGMREEKRDQIERIEIEHKIGSRADGSASLAGTRVYPAMELMKGGCLLHVAESRKGHAAPHKPCSHSCARALAPSFGPSQELECCGGRMDDERASGKVASLHVEVPVRHPNSAKRRISKLSPCVHHHCFAIHLFIFSGLHHFFEIAATLELCRSCVIFGSLWRIVG
jgi:hypothetical protein